MKILGIIPARYASTRLPAKPLALIGNKMMVQRVFEQVLATRLFSKIIVATDDERIKQPLVALNIPVVMTSALHQSGTDRCAEVLESETEKFDFVINIQGDEPFIHAESIRALVDILGPKTQIATLARIIEADEVLQNQNRPKVVFDNDFVAVNFSRAAPSIKNKEHFHEHIGLYAFRTDVLPELAVLPISELEKSERLEQLRWLENGYKIKVAFTTQASFAIDTQADLENARLKIEDN